MKGVPNCLVALALMALACSVASAYDPSPLQDFCVALNSTSTDSVFVNGKFCKDPKLVNANDFFFQGLNIPFSTANPLGINGTLVNVDLLPGLNTLGLSIARLDYAPYGVNPPHIHPRGTELLLVVEGIVQAGFVTGAPDYRFFTKILNPGDIFIFPIGLIHFNFNVGKTKAVAFASFGSQNPGVINIPEGVFGSNPPINPDFLAKSFQVDKKVIELLEKQFN